MECFVAHGSELTGAENLCSPGMIALPYTIVGPGTVVVKSSDTSAADMAVLGSQLLPGMAMLAPLPCNKLQTGQ